MKNRNLLLLVALLLTIFAVPSCNFVNVDSPEVGYGDFKPVFRVQGTVYTGNSVAVEGAKVIVGNQETTTDAEGKFNIESETAFPSGTSVTIIAAGYIDALSSIQYSDEAPMVQDFVFNLTRALPAGFVNLSTGGELVFEDVTVTVPGNNTATLDGQSLTTVQLSVTPLSPISTYGSFTGNSIKTLIFNPEGLEFEKPVTISIKVPEGFNAGNLVLSTFNSETNTWDNSEIVVDYNQATSTASFETKFFWFFKLNNPESLVILSNQYLVENTQIRYFLSTCDCEAPYNWGGGEYVKNYTLETTGGQGQADYLELYLLGFFGSNNISWSPYYIPGSLGAFWPGWPILNLYYYSPISLGNCTSKEVIYYRTYRQITGKYTFNNEEKFFTFKYYYGITTPVINTLPCTVHNGCHQGCGNQ